MFIPLAGYTQTTLYDMAEQLASIIIEDAWKGVFEHWEVILGLIGCFLPFESSGLESDV